MDKPKIETLHSVLSALPEDLKNFETEAVVVIAVRAKPDGKWEPRVISTGFKSPKDAAQACAYAARDIALEAGLITQEEADKMDAEAQVH